MIIMEKAILVGVILKKDSKDIDEENLQELSFLAFTAGAEVVKKFTQKLDHPNGRTYIGSGKVAEIKDYIKENLVDMVIFDDELGPVQIKNLEQAFECKILDRTNLILDIFAKRAQTSQAKTQVELAQYEYLLPRLTRMWTHLSRQKGGIGLRGPGETELETDRRIIRYKISLLKQKLEKINKQNSVQRKNRSNKVRVALVGYTNAGKSTIMNLLSKSDLFAEDKLFATLDTTVRNVVIEQVTFLMSDTVGFIRKLPHHLVESFKSTLDETREADILMHIVDISHPDFEQQIKTVKETLRELNSSSKPVLMVFNKIDKISNGTIGSADSSSIVNTGNLYDTFIAKENSPSVFISAKSKLNVDELRSTLVKIVKEVYTRVYPHYPLTVADK